MACFSQHCLEVRSIFCHVEVGIQNIRRVVQGPTCFLRSDVAKKLRMHVDTSH